MYYYNLLFFKIYFKKYQIITSTGRMTDQSLPIMKVPEHPIQLSPPKYRPGVYTDEEIIEMFGFEDQTAEWLRKREFDPEDPLLVLDYLPFFSNVHQNNFNANRQVIINAMRQNGAQMIDPFGRVFFFPTRDLVDAAHGQMQDNPNTSWAFHPFHHDYTQLYAHLGPTYQPKIITFGIGSTARNRFNVFQYQFFQRQ